MTAFNSYFNVLNANCTRLRMVMFSLTVVRHGETTYNRKNIIQGQTDVPLSTLGERQAQLVALRLKNECFTHVFSSDLSRAYSTAKIIADCNRVRKCDIILDKRLRERKFGSAEGKPSKEILTSSRKAKMKLIDYTPAGAETVIQVQERVEAFFKDLCTLCVTYGERDESVYTPAKIKGRHGGSLGRNRGPTKRLELNRRSQSFCGPGHIQNMINEMNMLPNTDDENNCSDEEFDLSLYQHNKFDLGQDSDDSEKVLEDYHFRESFPSGSDDSNLSSDLKSCSSGSSTEASGHLGSGNLLTTSDKLNESESDSTLSDHVNYMPLHMSDECEIQTDDSRLATDNNNASFFDEKDYMSQSSCPNVSLPPVIDQRISSVSSISSGRNSFDECDALPMNIADILIVSHGGFIKETVRYFVDHLDCVIPGTEGALRVCPNCSISKFLVTLDPDKRTPSVTCINVHDKDHLAELEGPAAEGLY